MNIITVKNYEEMSKMAAHILAAQVIAKPDSVLGLATGSTPIGIYDCLAEWCKNGEVDFSKAATVNLDEYRGLDHSNDQSYYYFMNKHLFSRINIDPSRTNVPDGTQPDPEKESKRYEALIKELGGIDIQLLGIGRNGHIGFNEPADDFTYGTHVVTLAADTIEANARFFKSADEVPRQAVSMGIGNIMAAKCVVLVATGESKAKAVYDTIRGPITPRVPASVLQLHPCCVILTDREAGKLMLEE